MSAIVFGVANSKKTSLYSCYFTFMEPKRFLYPLEQQLKFCQLETEVDFLLQQMQELKQNLCLSNNNPALQVNCTQEKKYSTTCKNNCS